MLWVKKAAVAALCLLYCVLSLALPLWTAVNVSLWYMAAWVILLPQCALLLYFVWALIKWDDDPE